MENEAQRQRFLALLALAKERIGNYSRIAEALGVKPANISQWKDGKHRVPLHTIDALSRLVLPEEKYPQKEEAIIIRETASQKVGRALDDLKKKLTEALRWSPLISWASAGNARAFEDQGYNVEWFPTTCKDPNVYSLQVEGDSMEPKHHNGDIIFVMPGREARNGDLVIARTKEDEVFFKKYHWTGHLTDPVKLVSFNTAVDDIGQPLYPVREFKRNKLRFIHPVHSVLRRYRQD